MTREEERLLAYRRTVAIMVIVIFLVLAFLIIRPFLVAIIGAAVLAHLFYPVYKYILKYMPEPLPGETLAAMITCILIVLIVLIPMIFIAGILANEAGDGYIYFKRVMSAPDFNFSLPPVISEKIGDISQFKDPFVRFGSQLAGWLQGVLTALPNAVLNLFLTIISVYFFLKGGSNMYVFLQAVFPLPPGKYRQIFVRFEDLGRGMVMGQIVVGVMHGVLAWGAYVFLGVPNAALWAFLTAIISIVPVLGAGMIWLPIAAYLFINGYAAGVYWKGIALFTYGLLIMTTIDNALKPKIIGDRSCTHPLIILFGILGGIQLIGLPGIIIGPLVLALFDVALEIAREVV